MRTLVSFPGNFMDAQQAARAFHERGALAAFVTGLVLDDKHAIARLLMAGLPEGLGQHIAKELRRRRITEVPSDMIISYPWLEGLRTVLARFSSNPIPADVAWDRMSRNFDRTVARRHLAGVQVVYAFEYVARHTFERAMDKGVARVLACLLYTSPSPRDRS